MDSKMTKPQRADQPCEPLKHNFYSPAASTRIEDDPTLQDESDRSEAGNSHTHEVKLDLETSPDVLADGSLNFFAGVMEFYESEGYAKYKTRKHREKCKISREELWSSKAEDLFLQMTLMIPPVFGKTKINCKTLDGHVESMGRNQLIAHLMNRHNPPVVYTRKKISSHKQVVHKLVASGGNEAALQRIEKDPRIVSAERSKDFYFDEASMTLRAGEIRHNFSATSALSRFVPGLQLLNNPTVNDTPMVHSVELNMGVYQRDTPAKDSAARLIHSCTTLQTPGGATAKSLEDIIPFIHLYPSLRDILKHDNGCDILWFDSSIDMLEQMPTTASHIGIEFKVEMLFANEYNDWKFKTNFYHHSGQLLHEIIRDPDVKLRSDSKVGIELSLFSAWWVKLFQSRILKRQEAGAHYRKQLEVLQHGSCTCKACLHLSAAMEEQVTDIDNHCRAYFQDMSIMQSIYAKPQGSQEHCCVAVFLFKFSQSSGNQIPLTTWHRIVRSDSEETEMFSEPSSILATQSDILVGPENTEWQSSFSDLAQRDIQNSWYDGDMRNFNVTKPYLDGSCGSVTEVGNLAHPAFSVQLDDHPGTGPFGSHVLTTDVIGQAHDAIADTSKYSEMIYCQELPSHNPKTSRSSSHQALHCRYLDDPIYTEGSANLQFHEMNLASFNIDDFSLETLDEANQMMDAHMEALHFDFNQPPIIPLTKNDCVFKAEQSEITQRGMADAPGILSFESTNNGTPTNQLSPTVVYQGSKKSDHSNFMRTDPSSQFAQTNRVTDSSANDCHNENQEAVYDQHQDLPSKTPVYHDAEVIHDGRNDLLSSIYDVQQDNTHKQGSNFQPIDNVSPNPRILPSDPSPYIPLAYGFTASAEGNTLDIFSQDRYLNGFDFCSQEDHHGEICNVPPTPPPSQDLPVATMISYQENVPGAQQPLVGGSPDWSASTDFDTHRWVVELAIAKTEDMIEEAYANYADEQNVKVIQGVTDVEAMAALLQSDHQGIEFNCQEVTVHPSGRILGEVDISSKDNIVEPNHYADCGFILPSVESIHADTRIESQCSPQDDISSSTTYFADDEFISQTLSRLEENTALDMEWYELRQDDHTVSLQKQIMDQQKGENSPNPVHESLLIDDSQDVLKDSHNISNTETSRTEHSTLKRKHPTTHYNSPQSVHSPLSNQDQLVSEYLRPNDAEYNSKRPRLNDSEAETTNHTSILNEQNIAVFTPQSIKIEISDTGDEDLDLTERMTVKIEEEREQRSQESYHVVGSESGSLSSGEQDKEWEKIKYEDVNASERDNMGESHS